MSRIADFVSGQDFSDAKTLQAVLAMARTLVLTDHLGRHPILVPLDLEVGVQVAEATTILLNFDLLQALLQNGRTDLREESTNVVEAHDFVFL